MKENAAHGGSASNFQHDVIYFLHSAFVHSTASSMRSLKRLRFEQYVTFELGPNDFYCDQTLSGANMFLFQILQSAAQYLRFDDVESKLDALCEQMNVLVSIDSKPLQAVAYGDRRPDTAASFSGYTNSEGVGGAYLLDTTTLTNGA